MNEKEIMEDESSSKTKKNNDISEEYIQIGQVQ